MRRVQQPETHHTTHVPKKHDRRSFIQRGAAITFATQGAIFATLNELVKKKKDVQNSTAPRTFGGVIHALRETVGYDMKLRIRNADNNQDTDSMNSDFDATSLAWDALQNAGSADVKSATDYLSNYRLSVAQQANVDPATIDCNDRANRACELLSKRGMPMYLVSIWPQDKDVRFQEDWHQMAACKLNDSCYLIIDNGKLVTIWQGPLCAFVSQYNDVVAMETIPHVGISRYCEPKYDNSFSKLLLQGNCAVASEEEMDSLNIQLPSSKGTQLAKR